MRASYPVSSQAKKQIWLRRGRPERWLALDRIESMSASVPATCIIHHRLGVAFTRDHSILVQFKPAVRQS